MASANGLQNNSLVVATIDGLTTIYATAIYTNGAAIDPTLYVKYANNTNNTDLGTFDLQTLGSISAKQHVLPLFGSTMMTGLTTSSIFYADSWKLNNTIGISSLGAGNYLSTSYLTISDVTNASTLLTLQSNGVADFGISIPRASTIATGNYDLVNLSTLQNSVAFILNVNALNYVPYTNPLQNLNMSGSTITTSGLVSAGAVRITSSVANTDYSLSVSGSDFLEFTNLVTNQKIYTNGGSLWLPGNVYNTGTVYSNDLQLTGTSYLEYGTIYQYGTNVNSGGKYQISDDTGNGLLTLNKTTGLTVSTMNITQVPSATPTYALGVNATGGVVSFAVPTAASILPLANTFTNTNTFLSTLTAGVGYTTSINNVLNTNLNDQGFTSASFTTSGIVGAYTPPLGTITNVSGSTYQIAQTASGRSVMAISGFGVGTIQTTYVFNFNINCTVGTATISVEQNGTLKSPALYPLSTGFNTVIGSFTVDGTSNTPVFVIYTGTASWNAQWTSFSLSTYSISAGANVSMVGQNRFTQQYNALSTDVSTLVNRSTLNSAITNISGLTSQAGGIGQTNTWTQAQTFSVAPTFNGLSVSTATYALGVNSSNQLVEFAVPASLLPLNNTWTGSNTFNALTSAIGYTTNLNNVIQISQPTSGVTATYFTTTGLPSTVPAGSTLSGSYTLTAGTSSNAMAIWLGTYVYYTGCEYTFTFSGISGSQALLLYVYQYNSSGSAFSISDAASYNITTTSSTVSGSFLPNKFSSALGSIVFYFQATAAHQSVSFSSFGMTVGLCNINGILTSYGATSVNNTFTVSGSTTLTGTLAVSGSATLSSVATIGNYITAPNQPFCIVGGSSAGSVGYGTGTNFGSSGNLYAYTSAGYTNTSGSGWDSTAAKFWATLTGRYQVNFGFYWNSLSAGARGNMQHYNSGGTLLETRYCIVSQGIGADTTYEYSTLVYMTAGDYLQFQLTLGSGTLYFTSVTHTHATFHYLC